MDLDQDQHTNDLQGLLDGQLELWHSSFAYMKSMALKSALDLGIADAINHHGGAATLPQIVAKAALSRSKISYLRRLMRVLTVSRIFSIQHPEDGGEAVYTLTPASRLLVGTPNMVPLLHMMLHPIHVSSFFDFGSWFQQELPEGMDHFTLKHGKTLWELADHDPAYNALLNDGMVSDSRFLMDIAVKECSDVFQGISSLVDVAGGLGGAAQTISKAFPHTKCSVMDLAHVIAKAPTGTDMEYVVGDMFESVPPANAVFLKQYLFLGKWSVSMWRPSFETWVLHDWGDAECVKILKNCKKAIPSRDDGGKVIVIDMVVRAGPQNSKHKETQVMYDLLLMLVNGIERDEQKWKKIIFEAGFSDYKIIPALGVRSIMKVYP